MLEWLNNPLLSWLLWLLKRIYWQFVSDGKVRLCYLSRAKKCRFEGPNVIYRGTNLSSVSLGGYSYVAAESNICSAEIGRFCSIGPRCQIGGGTHPSRGYISTHPAFYSTMKQSGVTFANENHFQEILPVEIGNDVWIGGGVTIVDGVKIGNGAIVATGAVVIKDVPAYQVVAGVPASLIRVRFPQERIQFLEKMQWWNNSPEWLKEHATLFRDDESFFETLKKENHP
ncbi:transferase hexapeptide (six repeat-containing protein) [Desulforhopalus singaporensis]|uniref:Transferase hexapeptide (Six repeat-containing protein) n=2 Tax=Desulforhopalus singaporensis TaxID=91360 RepID=A0A1H0QQW0_9BACT|nr:transferase hexapeptide (six repeat-containing protein) [Desulforhopalus singaporensis]